MSPKTHKLLSVLLLLLLVANYLPLVVGAAYTAAKSPGKPFAPRQLSYPIAIIGDYPRSADSQGDLYTLLINNGYTSGDIMQYTSVSDFITDLNNGQLYSVVILNRWSDNSDPASGDEVVGFVKALDIRDIPLLILDSGYTSHTGGDAFYQYKDDLAAAGYPAPLDQIQHYPNPSKVIMDPVDASHAIFSGVPDPYYLVNTSYSYADYMAWSGFMVTVTRLAWLNDTQHGENLYGIAEWVASGGESWIFMAAGSGKWVRYTEAGSDSQYSSDQATVFVNAVNYLIGTGNPHVPPKGIVYGYVTDAATGQPIANATVSAGAVTNTTNATGYYMLKLDPGTYTVTVTREPSYEATSFTVTISGGDTHEINVTLTLKPKGDVFVALIGDESDNDLYNFLKENYSVILYSDIPSFMAGKDAYEWDVIILNQISGATETDLVNILSYANMMNIGVLVLDTWSSSSAAGYKFYKYRDTLLSYGFPAPAERSTDYESTTPSNIQVEVINITHPLFTGITSPYPVVASGASEVDYAYYGSFTMPVTVLANLSDAGSNLGIAIAEWKAPGNESWIFMSYACNIWNHYNTSTTYGYFSEEAKKVLIHAIDYINTTHTPPPKVKIYGYVYDETMNPISGARVWIEGTSYVNYTDSTGYYEFNNVFGNAVYTIKAAKLGYYIETRVVSVGDTDIQVDIILHSKPPSIVIVGDHDTTSGKKDLNLTLSEWWTIQEASDYKELWDIINYEGQVIAVIFNSWIPGYTTPSSDDVIETLKLLDNHSIHAIFLAGYGGGYYGIYPLYSHESDIEAAGYPAPDQHDYWYYPDADKLWMNMTNPDLVFFKNIAPDTDDAFHIHADLTSYGSYRGYNFTDDSVRVAAWFTDLDDDQVWGGVVTWNTSSGAHWVYMIGASTDYVRYTESGDKNQYNYKMKLLLNNTINYLLGLTPPTLTGNIYGYVNDTAGAMLSDVMVEIVELGLINYTDINGYYEFNNVPTGTWTLRFTKKFYYEYTVTAAVGVGEIEVNATLTPYPYVIAVIGDRDENITNLLLQNSIPAIHYDTWEEVRNDLCAGAPITAVVIDRWSTSTPSSEDVISFLKLLDAYGISVVFLDTGVGYTATGIRILYEYHDEIRAEGFIAPVYRDYDYSGTTNLAITMNDTTSPLFNGITPDADQYFNISRPGKSLESAWIGFDPADPVHIIGYLIHGTDGIKNVSVAEWTAPRGEKWIFLTAASVYWISWGAYYGADGDYTDKAAQLLINAVKYANSSRGTPISTVVYQLTVMDEITGSPIDNAAVYVNETGDTYYTAGDGTVIITLPFRCGNYTLIISKSGYVSRIVSLFGYSNTSLTVYLAQFGNGTITGYVYDAETGDPISGANVSIPGINWTLTGPDGKYTLKAPAGKYTIYVTAPKYLAANTTVVVPANTTVTKDFYLEKQPPTILIVGDYYDDIKTLLESYGYTVDTADDFEDAWTKLPLGNYVLVIINNWGTVSAENVTAMLTYLDSNNIPAIFLDSDSYSYRDFGVKVLYDYRDNVTALGYPAPSSRSEAYRYTDYVYLQMLYPNYPLFNDITPDTDNMFNVGAGQGYYVDYAYYTFDPAPGLMLLGNLIDTYYDINATALAVWVAPGGERWIFMGVGASYYYMEYTEIGGDDQYSENMAKLLVNAIEYALTYNNTPTITFEFTVYDSLDETPLEGVNISIPELSIWTLTNAEGKASLTATAGLLTIVAEKAGYTTYTRTSMYLDTMSGTIAMTIYLNPYGNGTITGYVYDAETGDPISGANVSIPGINWTLTGPDGKYTLKAPAGRYTEITATHLLYLPATVTGVIKVYPNTTTTVNITMTRKPPMVLIVASSDTSNSGPVMDADIKAFIESLGYYVEVYPTITDAYNVISAGLDVRVVVLDNVESAPGDTVFLQFIQLLDTKNISIIVLDTWGSSYRYGGGYLFYTYRTTLRSNGYFAPVSRSYDWVSSSNIDKAKLVITKDVYGFTYGIGFTEASPVTPGSDEFDYAYYTFDSGDLIETIVYINDTYNNLYIPAVFAWYPSGGERWIFITYGANYWVTYTSGDAVFSDEAKLILARAINYAWMRGVKIEVENFTIIPPRENGVIMPGDQIRITGTVYYWVGNTKNPLANETLKVYMLSTPYVIGSVTTGPDGSFDTTITVPNSTPTGEHAIGLGGASYTIYILSPPGQPGANRYLFLPAPEPQLLPLLLLAALLLIVMFKKRR